LGFCRLVVCGVGWGGYRSVVGGVGGLGGFLWITVIVGVVVGWRLCVVGVVGLLVGVGCVWCGAVVCSWVN